MTLNPTKRFSNRAEAYALSRPAYPQEILEVLSRQTGLKLGGLVADIGSGTGILTRQLLEAGYKVIAVEPNAPMRAIAESRLASYPDFISIDGKAEDTGLRDASVDLITVAQAFHWFEIESCRSEFRRIMKPEGRVALLWNFRNPEGEGFTADYERLLLEFSLDYTAVRESYPTRDSLIPFFGSSAFEHSAIPNPETFDLERAKRLLNSSSFMPAADHPRYLEMMSRLEETFERWETNGNVRMVYETVMYVGGVFG